MASKDILPKRDLQRIIDTPIGEQVMTRFGAANVSGLAKKRARFALKHFDDDKK